MAIAAFLGDWAGIRRKVTECGREVTFFLGFGLSKTSHPRHPSDISTGWPWSPLRPDFPLRQGLATNAPVETRAPATE